MSVSGIDQVLAQMRQVSIVAEAKPVTGADPTGVAKADFSTLLQTSIDKVNDTQKTAGVMTEAFSAGDPDTDLSEVMIALQKASVSFQAMTEVRNKLVSAYQDVMNMQV
ncbi:MAG: flagellar hook-basal body complex protein FliE [Gammaproteobacteria bacterium]